MSSIEHRRRDAARHRARRAAAKAGVPLPACRQCGTVIDDVGRLASPKKWARVYCGGACRQAAWRNRHGE